MTAKDCIKSRRSIRKFTDQPVAREVIEEIIDTARFAPSWKNTQITRYTVVTDPGLKEKIANECTTIFPMNASRILSAPVLVCVSVIKARSGYERDGSFSTHRGEGWQMFDAGVASQTFCLAAHEHGLGTVILGLFDDDKVAAAIDLPENQDLVALIPMGYPDESPEAPSRKSVEDLVRFL